MKLKLIMTGLILAISMNTAFASACWHLSNFVNYSGSHFLDKAAAIKQAASQCTSTTVKHTFGASTFTEAQIGTYLVTNPPHSPSAKSPYNVCAAQPNSGSANAVTCNNGYNSLQSDTGGNGQGSIKEYFSGLIIP